MDLVYIIGGESQWEDNELRYSIRSMAKYLRGFDRIVIAGRRPSFLRDVIHIQVADDHANNPSRNIYEKILAVCDRDGITGSFIAASDDYFLLSGFNASTFPYYQCGPLSDTVSKMTDSNYYKRHVQNTMTLLSGAGLPTLNFNVHCPIVYNKELFKLMMPEYNWEIKKGYLSKSLYANTLKISGEFVKDTKIHTPKTRSAIHRKIDRSKFFSTNEHSINPEMMQVLQELYPDPSPWEA